MNDSPDPFFVNVYNTIINLSLVEKIYYEDNKLVIITSNSSITKFEGEEAQKIFSELKKLSVPIVEECEDE